MYRAFVCTWSGSAGGRITHPILEWLENPSNDPPFEVVCSMHYPDADVNGVPDKPEVLVLVWQPTGAVDSLGRNIEFLDTLAGVYMIPAYRLSKPVSEIPQPVKNDILNKLQAKGIPKSTFNDVVVYRDFLKKIAKYFKVGHIGFGNHIEIDADLEFE